MVKKLKLIKTQNYKYVLTLFKKCAYEKTEIEFSSLKEVKAYLKEVDLKKISKDADGLYDIYLMKCENILVI